MIALTADENILLKDLRGFVEPVEVYEPSGKLLGLFVPANLERGKEIQARVEAQIDWAEIERRKQANEPVVPLRETLGRLNLLEAEIERRKAAGEKEFTTEEALAYFQSLQGRGLPGPSPIAEAG